jgi:membrane protease YdiL (CAAX protease family)
LEIFGLALYGCICEELLCRLFALSLIFYIFAWTGILLGIIISVIISSLIFALRHLPTALNLIGGHREVVKRTIYLNIIGGVVFCFIFIFFGLFFSMVSHATSDIILNIMNLKIK